MNDKKKYMTVVAHFFTAVNLLSGFVAVLWSTQGKFAVAGWLIFAAGIIDGVDGRIARISRRSSDFGMQLDSLADMVSAGVAPSYLIYLYYLKSIGTSGIIGLLLSFLPLLFCMFRLARYNVMAVIKGHQEDYYGLPAPMAASTLVSLVILHVHTRWSFLLVMLVILPLLLSVAMISPVRYSGLPRFTLKDSIGNWIKLLLFFTAILFAFIVPEYTLFVFMMIYILSGPIQTLYKAMKSHFFKVEKEELEEKFVTEHTLHHV